MTTSRIKKQIEKDTKKSVCFNIPETNIIHRSPTQPTTDNIDKFLEYHNTSENEDSILSMICNFHPETATPEEAEKLLLKGKKLESLEGMLEQLITKYSANTNATELEKQRSWRWQQQRNQLHCLSSWINDKHTDYKSTFEKSLMQKNQIANAFKKIYNALYTGETGLFKSNFMAGRENYTNDELMQDIKKDHSERTGFALKLAQRYCQDYSYQNENLFTAIYKFSFANSSIFKRSCMLGITIFSSFTLNKYSVIKLNPDFIDKHPESRSAKISFALGYHKRSS